MRLASIRVGRNSIKCRRKMASVACHKLRVGKAISGAQSGRLKSKSPPTLHLATCCEYRGIIPHGDGANYGCGCSRGRGTAGASTTPSVLMHCNNSIVAIYQGRNVGGTAPAAENNLGAELLCRMWKP